MKNIFITTLAAMIMVLAACKKEDKVVISTHIVVPVISTPATATTLVVTPADSAALLSVQWSKANYGVNAVLGYFVQVDSSGNGFKKSISLLSTKNDTLTLSNGAFNTLLLNGLGLAPNAVSKIDIRIGVSLSGKDTVYSAPITMVITTYKQLAPLQLYVPGQYQNWSPSTAPLIYPVTTFTYEGFVYMQSAGYFKFTSDPDWTHVNYGDGGNGKLTTNGEAGAMSNAAGYFKLNADIKNLTYSASLIRTFGIIGTATAQSWNSSTPMTFNTANGTWSVTTNLTAGALKFRANDAWDINYGPANSANLTGLLIQTNDAINITSAGRYTITMDMSQTTQKNYTYSVVQAPQ